MSIELSAVIPCYRSSDNIEELNERLFNSINKLTSNFEIIYVNDCSPDDTLVKLKRISKNYTNLKIVDLMFNVGQYKATICGFKHSKGEYVLTMDDDLQHPPEEICKLFYKIKNNPDIDVVIGKAIEKKHNIIRRMGSSLVSLIHVVVFHKQKNFKITAFRCLRRCLVDAILSNKTIYPMMSPMILSYTSPKRRCNVEFLHQDRKYGKSGYSYFKLIKITLSNILNFSSLPLKFIGYIGFISFALSLIFIIYFLLRKIFFGITATGWTSIILFINFYSGLVLLSLGIVGEYLIRILNESKRMPLYFEREIIDNNKKS